MKLNDNQKAAIASRESICVVACAGSGKTRTIVGKLINCVEEVRYTPRRIACITYTNAAVDEIDRRLREFGSTGDDAYCEVGTIHSFCLTNILQPFHHMLPEFRDGMRVLALDSEDWKELVSWLADKHGIRQSRTEGFANVQRTPNGSVFSREIAEEAAEELLSYLDAHALVSLPDIVYHASRLVEMAEFIPRGLASRFAWILIDEFQDTSDGQVAILSSIARLGKSKFFMVGDVNQSIMSFAGAHPSLMESFADEVNARKDIALPGNYRSSTMIIGHAEMLIPTNMCAIGEWKDYPVEPRYLEVEDPTKGIVEKFLPALRALAIPLGKAAILAPWWRPLYHLARDLTQLHIPVVGPGARPYKRRLEFASLAEHLCAYIEQKSADLFRPLQRALFNTLINITGSPDWRVFSYDGRRTICGLAVCARAIREEHGSTASLWLTTAADSISERLLAEEFLTAQQAQLLRDSAQAMIGDMLRNGVDPGELNVNDLGLFARPRECLQLITMHKAKGREFDAVALIDLHDGRLPHFSWETSDEYEEARRQMYVAITRARKLLMYFTDSSDWRNRPSPFLSEIGVC
jgi:DNA helicase-2/ATP-dependent DNA helicase PcrA